ncbi:hypothetical protein IEQ34_005282 [Dendrobium chrysotoxum]|uniref:Uncharacterized protein n=1 Tax=Dendrobium chrysotoxum TaxID=161865 RepID=A0AAV7GUL2_DENCH|nr:hypothetical protein IEQ34_004768 [Dendrobium chrysotoxum]KAH0465179.1 hypothetical protein IEQ34_005282 [Dendrobium chrysotoxum]
MFHLFYFFELVERSHLIENDLMATQQQWATGRKRFGSETFSSSKLSGKMSRLKHGDSRRGRQPISVPGGGTMASFCGSVGFTSGAPWATGRKRFGRETFSSSKLSGKLSRFKHGDSRRGSQPISVPGGGNKASFGGSVVRHLCYGVIVEETLFSATGWQDSASDVTSLGIGWLSFRRQEPD